MTSRSRPVTPTTIRLQKFGPTGFDTTPYKSDKLPSGSGTWIFRPPERWYLAAMEAKYESSQSQSVLCLRLRRIRMPKNLVALPRSQLPFRGMITNNHVIHIEKYKGTLCTNRQGFSGTDWKPSRVSTLDASCCQKRSDFRRRLRALWSFQTSNPQVHISESG